jgi:hypothetical protein
MSGFLERISNGKWSMLGLLRSRRAALVACGLAMLLLLTQSARAWIAHSREEAYLARTRLEAASAASYTEGGDAGSHGAGGVGGVSDPDSAANANSPILKLLPKEGQPGLLLSDLFAILDQAGIDTYRYRLLVGQTVEPGSEAVASPIGDRPIEELLQGDDLDRWEGADLVPIGLEGVEIPPPPPGVQKWELALAVRASYVRLINAMRLLEADERIWALPRVVVHRGQGETEADLRLVTYTQDPAREGDGPALELPARPNAFAAVRDPFARTSGRGSGASPMIPPRLGAIRLGAGEAAWLDGGPVRTGERSGMWTVLSIKPGEVWVRHDNGDTRCLRLGDVPRKDSTDVQP